jgi:hypothetical protein
VELLSLDSDVNLHFVRTLLLRIAIPLALVAAPAVALASSGSNHVAVTDCTKEVYKPSGFVLACGDGTSYLTKMKWTTWTGSRATGAGTDEVNACNPDCADGHFKGYAVTVTLSDVKSCHKQKHKVFNDLHLTYTSTHPKGFRRSSQLALGCPF